MKILIIMIMTAMLFACDFSVEKPSIEKPPIGTELEEINNRINLAADRIENVCDELEKYMEE